LRKTKDSRRYKAVKISEKGWLLVDTYNLPLKTHKVDGVVVPVWIEKVKRRKVKE